MIITVTPAAFRQGADDRDYKSTAKDEPLKY